jgi:CHAT domain-containing protein
MRCRAAALLLFYVAACHAHKEQSVAPQTLYAGGREAFQRGEYVDTERIAKDGQSRFAAQPYWRELFGILEAEAIAKKGDRNRAAKLLEQTPQSGARLPAARRLMTLASMQSGSLANETFLRADTLAPAELRPEIAMRRAGVLTGIDLQEAEHCAQQAVDAAGAAKQTWVLASAYNNLAFAQHKQGRYGPAIEHYGLSVKYAQIARARPLEVAAMTNLGWCHLDIGDLDTAAGYLRPALDLAAQQSMPSWEHTAAVHLAEIYVRRLEFQKALPYAEHALKTAQSDKELANSFLQLGEIELELGRLDAAKRWNEQALAKRPRDDVEGALSDRFSQARILAATGDPARALKILDDVLAAKPDPATRWRAQGVQAQILAKLAHLPEAEQKYEETLATGAKERAKVEGTSSFAFERNFLSFYEGYIDLLLSENDAVRALNVAERSRARTLRQAINPGDTNDVDPVALARLKNATILCYWLGAKRSFLWTVTPRGITVATLPADDVIDRAADDYRKELLSARHKLTASTLGPKLYQMLVAPAGPIAAGSRVIILPDAHLRALSFDALIVPATPPHYWIEDVTISYSPSLNLLASTPAWKSMHDPRALIFGDVPGEGQQFPKLKRAGREIGEVAQHFGSRAVVRSGLSATPAAYKAADPRQFQFIHFAAHATAGTDRPIEESAVILAPDADGFRLSGEKIVGVPLKAELVTVSSCNSAGRRNYAGEGLVGLAWAFLRAGARRVVAAQWEVDDSAAPPMMNKMYAAIVGGGVEPAEALRQAKLYLLHSDTPHKQPLYWAPFAIYGAL